MLDEKRDVDSTVHLAVLFGRKLGVPISRDAAFSCAPRLPHVDIMARQYVCTQDEPRKWMRLMKGVALPFDANMAFSDNGSMLFGLCQR